MTNKDIEIFKLTRSQNGLRMSSTFALDKKGANENNIITFYFDVKEDCNNELLEKAYNLLRKNNDSLRLKIFRKGFSYYQFIKPYEPVSLEVLKMNSRDEALKYMEGLMLNQMVYFTADDLLWTKIVDYGSGSMLVVRGSHFCFDGFSLTLIFKQLEAFYKALENGEEDPSFKAGTIKDYFKAEDTYLASERHKNDIKYLWKTFNSRPHYKIPVRYYTLVGKADLIKYKTSSEVYNKLINFANTEEYSSIYLFHAFCGLITNRVSGAKDFAVSTLTHGRTNFKLKSTIGCMMTIAPIFFDIDENMKVSEFLKAQYPNYLNAFAHANLSLSEQLLPSYPQSIKNGFNFNHSWMLYSAMDYGTAIKDSRFGIGLQNYSTIPYPMYNTFFEKKGEYICLSLNYQKSIFKREKIEEIVKRFTEMVEKIANNPDIKICEL